MRRHLVLALLGALCAPVLAAADEAPVAAAARDGATERVRSLLRSGNDVNAAQGDGMTALHWAAIMGLDRLASALADAGSELELADDRYACTPLEWALHGWTEGTNGRHAGIPLAARALVERGARVPPDAPASLAEASDAPMREALGVGPGR